MKAQYDCVKTWFHRLSAIAAFFASIAIIVASVVGYKTINEMKEQRLEMQEQRRSSYQPEIIIVQKDVWFPAIKALDFHAMHKQYKDIAYGDNALNLHNIGNGPAREFKINWELPIDEFEEFFNKRNSKRFQIKTRKNDNVHTSVGLIMDDGNEFHTGLSNEGLEFLLPYSNYEKPYEIGVPNIYIMLLSLYFGQMDKEEQQKVSKRDRQHPALRAIVTYRDIGDELHTVVFKSAFNVNSISFYSGEANYHIELSFTKENK